MMVKIPVQKPRTRNIRSKRTPPLLKRLNFNKFNTIIMKYSEKVNKSLFLKYTDKKGSQNITSFLLEILNFLPKKIE